jgi:hypothetical protein
MAFTDSDSGILGPDAERKAVGQCPMARADEVGVLDAMELG